MTAPRAETFTAITDELRTVDIARYAGLRLSEEYELSGGRDRAWSDSAILFARELLAMQARIAALDKAIDAKLAEETSGGYEIDWGGIAFARKLKDVTP
jgi:hypothetical protein